MEIGGVLVVLLLLARVARAWIKTGDEFLTLWRRVEKFFDERKQLRRPPKTTQLDDDISAHSDAARKLVFEVGEHLGFDALSCEKLIEIVGNPISALKYLVAAGNEGRKLAHLEQTGLLQLPAPSGEAIVLHSPGTKRRTSSGVEVIKKATIRKPKME